MLANEVHSSPWENPVFQSRRTVDLLCRRFEELWHSEDRLSIEQFLTTTDAQYHDDLLPELIAAEWDLRASEDEIPQRTDYVSRFPKHAQLLAELELTCRESSDSCQPQNLLRPPAVGDDFSGYRILKELGRGAMGTVYLAEVPVVAHRVALKILGPRLQQDPIGAARFEREARLLSKLDHPGIVPLYSYGEFDGIRYLVMKAIDGSSLSSAIKRECDQNGVIELLHGPQNPERAETLTAIALQLLNALAAVHKAGVLHRDIKPSNVLLTPAGQAYLTDFSLARTESSDPELTRSDEFVGTLRYCAPESLDGRYSRQSDLYSLGLVLFEMFSLKSPFEAVGRRDLLSKKLSGTVAELQTACEGLPESMVHILRRMTCYSPEERYQTTSEVIDAITNFLPTKIEPTSQSRMPRLTITAMLAVFVFTMIASIMRNSSERTVPAHGSDSVNPSSVMSPKSSSDLSKTTALTTSSDIGNSLASSHSTELWHISHLKGRSPDSKDQESDQWLIPRRVFDLPGSSQVTLMSLSTNGEHLMLVVDGQHAFSGLISGDDLSVTKRTQRSIIVAADQSEDGQLMLLCHRNSDESNEFAEPYFVETYSKNRKGWERVPGPPYDFRTEMPTFTLPPRKKEHSNVLIPDTTWPTLWQPSQGAYLIASWPAGARAAVACFGMWGAMAMRNGDVHIFPLGVVVNPRKVSTVLDPVPTSITECRSLQFSSDGTWVLILGNATFAVIHAADAKLIGTHVLMGLDSPRLEFSDEGDLAVFSDKRTVRILSLTSQKWLGEPLALQHDLIDVAVVDRSDGGTGPVVVCVESSGRVSRYALRDDKWRLHNETQLQPVTKAAVRLSQNRLIVAEASGQVSSFDISLPLQNEPLTD